MLLFFRNIQFTTAVTLALYVGLLHFAALSGHLAPTLYMPDGGLPFDDIFGWTKNNTFGSAVVAAILVFFQALLVNSVADHFRLMEDRNWLPGMAYALVASALPDFQFLSPPLVAVTFLIVAIRQVFSTYKSPKSAVLVFDTAFWMAVGGLFYPKSLVLALALFIGVGVMRSWNARDQLAFFSGLFVPIFLGWTWYFWGDIGAAFRDRHLGHILGFSHFDAPFDTLMILKCVFWGLLLLLFTVNFSAFSRSKSMQGQKCVEVLYWVLFLSIVMTMFRPEWRWETLALSAAPAGILLAMTYQNMRSRFAEGLHLLLLAAMLLFQYFPF